MPTSASVTDKVLSENETATIESRDSTVSATASAIQEYFPEAGSLVADDEQQQTAGRELPTQYQEFIAKSRYARWDESKGRREHWSEVVQRYIDFWHKRRGFLSSVEAQELYSAIYDLRVMPSMRCMMTAGDALERDQVAGYNCAFLAIDNPRAFDELLYILMCGTGVGFSVERENVAELPEIPADIGESDETIIVPDSKIGWAESLRSLIKSLYTGKIPNWDLSQIRPEGTPLKTFGGRASGPEPLNNLFHFTVNIFRQAAGRQLKPIEAHDLVCKIADIVVVGGVRRAALISLSSVDDEEMREAKTGAWWEDNVQRALANNSAVFDETPEFETFLREWQTLYTSRSGERGIFSRPAARKQAAASGRRDANCKFGTNPCSEIILRSRQFCNLSEVVIRAEDDLDSLCEKVRLASVLGTLQATLSDFRYLSDEWRHNTEEEALLGVSLTGVMDHPVMNGSQGENKLRDWLVQMRETAVLTNRHWAHWLGINRAAAITCIKPSGTVSQLTNSASGIHPRYSRYYIRRVRADHKDPLARFMQDKGFPCEDDQYSANNKVFSFPVAAPDSCVTRNAFGALDQLALWKIYQDLWCEHKPSMTTYYRDEEFLEVGSWVYKNFDSVSGIAFLPHTDHVFVQAPYEEIDEDTYERLKADMPPDIDWAEMAAYEREDQTSAGQELACSGGTCEL